jgi:ribosomal-protein-alanine N-acetyltransferase
MMNDKKPQFPTPPSLVGEKVYLRLATAEDIANTYHWTIQSDPQSLSCRPRVMYTAAEAAENFKKQERSVDRQTFIIVRKADKVPVGRITYFDMNTLNRFAELGLIIDPDERRKGHALEALRLLSHYLFRFRGLNKVHAQTASYNEPTRKLLEKAGFKRDATLRHHYFWKGEFQDGYIYSLLAFEYER